MLIFLMDYRSGKGNILLKNIKKSMPSLEKTLENANSICNYEDLVYRFYHGSFKVYRIQELTKHLVKSLEEISPNDDKKITDNLFLKIISEGAKGIPFKMSHNREWGKICRPFLEAFFHSRYFLEMAIKYGKKYDSTPTVIEPGLAALMTLYGI